MSVAQAIKNALAEPKVDELVELVGTPGQFLRKADGTIFVLDSVPQHKLQFTPDAVTIGLAHYRLIPVSAERWATLVKRAERSVRPPRRTRRPVAAPGAIPAGRSLRTHLLRGSLAFEPTILPPPHGLAATIAELAKRGVELRLAPDGTPYGVTDGVIAPGLVAWLDRESRLLAAHLAGKPLTCAWCKAPAEETLAGGTPVCAEHPGAEELPAKPQRPAVTAKPVTQVH